MKVDELFEEGPTLLQAMKAISSDFKALANKFQLTLVAGMGWPNITKDGAWMGGGLGPARGITDEKAALNIEKRRHGFILALARRLEALIQQGHTVKIALGANRSDHTEVAEAGRVEEQLFKNIKTMHPPGNVRSYAMPCIVWFVSAPADVSTAPLLSVQLGILDRHTSYGFGAYNSFRLPPDADFEKKLTRWFGKVNRMKTYKWGERTDYLNPKYPPEYKQFVLDYLEHAFKSGIEVRMPENKNITLKSIAESGVPRVKFEKTRVHAKDAKIYDIELILPVLKKHGFQP